ncbi:MAG: DNA-binding transcriptional ArsR family regulator [Crocinitomix sp.]|jgi:DNA-binding transcriptional ArsR family regulator
MSKKYSIDKIFKALADSNRREIFHLLVLATSALSLTQITAEFDISRQGITKHIKLMEDAGLIQTNNKGRERFCEVNPTPLNEIKDWLAVYDKFWDDKLKNLGDFLDNKA